MQNEKNYFFATILSLLGVLLSLSSCSEQEKFEDRQGVNVESCIVSSRASSSIVDTVGLGQLLTDIEIYNNQVGSDIHGGLPNVQKSVWSGVWKVVKFVAVVFQSRVSPEVKERVFGMISVACNSAELWNVDITE